MKDDDCEAVANARRELAQAVEAAGARLTDRIAEAQDRLGAALNGGHCDGWYDHDEERHRHERQ